MNENKGKHEASDEQPADRAAFGEQSEGQEGNEQEAVQRQEPEHAGSGAQQTPSVDSDGNVHPIVPEHKESWGDW